MSHSKVRLFLCRATAVGSLFLSLIAPTKAEDVRLRYDSRGNVVAIEDAAAPLTLRIERFAPAYGRPGDSVTIVGTGFLTTPALNLVSIGGITATVTAAAADHLKVTVPSGVASGPIAVTVGAATATSAQSFTALPSTLSAADVATATEIVTDAPAVRVNTLANRNALVAFSGQSGDLLSFQFPQIDLPALGSASYQVFSPSGSSIASGTLYETMRTVHLPPLPASGRYALYFKSTIVMRSQVALESAAVVTVDGAALTSGTTFRGQSRRLQFAGTAGQNLGFALSDRTAGPAGASILTPVFYRPGGTVTLTSLSNLPQTGTYSIVVSNSVTTTQSSFNAWLSNDLMATLALNQLTTASVTRPGQMYRYGVAGTAGQRLRLATRPITTAGPSSQRVSFYIYKPDGSCLEAVCSYIGSASEWVHTLPPLPVAGTYTVVADINPYDDNAATFSAPFALSEEVAVTLTADGSAVAVATTAPGQFIRATFNGTAGQNLGFAYTDLTITPVSAYLNGITYYAPSGATIASLTNLPQSGTYSILIAPSAQTTQVSTKLWLSNDLLGTTAINQTTTSAVARPGQAYRYTFAGIAGQKLRLHTGAATTTPAGLLAAIYLYAPSGGNVVPSPYYVGANAQVELPALPATGTYTVLVDMAPNSNQNAAFSIAFTMAEELTPALVIDDGSAVSVATTVPGQAIRASFTGTAGQNLGFAFTDLSLTPAGAYVQSVTYYAPNGTALTSLTNLPQSGTYKILILFSQTTTLASMNLWLSSDATGTLSAGTATAVAVTRPGQAARYTYAGTAGKQLRQTTSGTTTTAPASQRVAVYVYKPDGSCLFSNCYYNANTGSGGSVDLPALPTTGTYTFVFDINPYDNANASFSTNVTLTVLNP